MRAEDRVLRVLRPEMARYWVLRREMLLRRRGGVLGTPSRATLGLITLRTRSSALINATLTGLV